VAKFKPMPLLLQFRRYLATQQNAPRYETRRPARLPYSGVRPMPRILVGIIWNRCGSKTHHDLADSLPNVLKLLTPLLSAGKKLVVQRLLTLLKFKDRGFLWPRPILPSVNLSRIRLRRKPLTDVLEPRNGCNVLDESRDSLINVAFRVHETMTMPETLTGHAGAVYRAGNGSARG